MQNYNWVVIGVGVIAKQPKRGTVAFDKGYIEVYEYPRADRAVITYTAEVMTSLRKEWGLVYPEER